MFLTFKFTFGFLYPRWSSTGAQLNEKISTFAELLAAWQIYNDQYVTCKSGLGDKEREVNTLMLQQDAAESPERHVDQAKVKLIRQLLI